MRVEHRRSSSTQACEPARNWTVYIIEASDRSLYTGVSTDVQRRLREHASGARGARYFRGRTVLELRWLESGHDRSSACRREAEIKRWPRARKLALIAQTALETGT